MALYSLLFAGGRGAAKNPNLSAPSWVGNLLGGSGSFPGADPLGNLITGIGGDPLNLYGNKDNPNALLFPSRSPMPGGSASGGLPFSIGAQGGYKPQLPTGFSPPRAPMGGKSLNFQGMPGFPGAPQQGVNPFLAAMMQYLAPPKASPAMSGNRPAPMPPNAPRSLPYLPPRMIPMQRMQ